MKRSLCTPALALALAAFALTPSARADEPASGAAASASTTAPPADHYPPPSVRGKLILGGLVISGVAYGAAFAAGLIAPEVRDAKTNALAYGIAGSQNLKIPFAGPWLTVAKAECPKSTLPGASGCDAGFYIGETLLVIDGLAQAAGVSLLIEALVMKTESSPAPKSGLASRSSTSLPFRLPLGVTWRPVPVATTRFTGLGIVGTF